MTKVDMWMALIASQTVAHVEPNGNTTYVYDGAPLFRTGPVTIEPTNREGVYEVKRECARFVAKDPRVLPG